jgi:hypothetical protein
MRPYTCQHCGDEAEASERGFLPSLCPHCRARRRKGQLDAGYRRQRERYPERKHS